MSMMQHEFDEDDDEKGGDGGVALEPRPLFMHANGVKVVNADTPELVGWVGMFDVVKMYILVDGGEDGSRGMWSTGLEREQSPSGRVVGLWYHDHLYGLKHCADLAQLVDDDAMAVMETVTVVAAMGRRGAGWRSGPGSGRRSMKQTGRCKSGMTGCTASQLRLDAYVTSGEDPQWCRRNYPRLRSIHAARSILEQLVEVVCGLGSCCRSNSGLPGRVHRGCGQTPQYHRRPRQRHREVFGARFTTKVRCTMRMQVVLRQHSAF
ncbi:hypothetical protein HK405_002548 [Cladochytrium tenue]|nr:hypothetical protein HK405_002548 [Cladochytrium tenue]